MVNRRLMDASPASVLRHRVDSVKGLMDDNEDFRKSKGSDNKIVQYVNVTRSLPVSSPFTCTNCLQRLISKKLKSSLHQ